MKFLALSAIKLYQRFISPLKGFCCAYRAHTGHASCSALGHRALQRFGVWGGLGVLRKRLVKCGVAHRRYSGQRTVLNRQAGFCDLSCDLPCDFDLAGAVDAFSSCGSCDCGNWGRSRKNQRDEKWVHIPPNSKLNRKLD
jgi:putative component of membrane protein insertase Oxa1/YidC/SpoIIIJ protein YidD